MCPYGHYVTFIEEGEVVICAMCADQLPRWSTKKEVLQHRAGKEELVKTSSCKAKGRKLQQTVRDALLEIGKQYGLETGDITSTSMGASGVDVILSPAAKKLFGHMAIECKAVESLNVTGEFYEHAEKYPEAFALLVHKRNHTDPLCTIRLTDFVYMLQRLLWSKATPALQDSHD